MNVFAIWLRDSVIDLWYLTFFRLFFSSSSFVDVFWLNLLFFAFAFSRWTWALTASLHPHEYVDTVHIWTVPEKLLDEHFAHKPSCTSNQNIFPVIKFHHRCPAQDFIAEIRFHFFFSFFLIFSLLILGTREKCSTSLLCLSSRQTEFKIQFDESLCFLILTDACAR